MAMCTGADYPGYDKLIEMKKLNQFFELRKAYGVIFLRLVIGWKLIAGAGNYVFHLKSISNVEDYFSTLHLPAPLLSAYLSVYAQFICAVLLIIGLWFRPAAIVMIINFTLAIIAAHLNDGIEKSFAAWVILAASSFFLFNGAGKVSIESRVKL
jgi:putative oxidoreductase